MPTELVSRAKEINCMRTLDQLTFNHNVRHERIDYENGWVARKSTFKNHTAWRLFAPNNLNGNPNPFCKENLALLKEIPLLKQQFPSMKELNVALSHFTGKKHRWQIAKGWQTKDEQWMIQRNRDTDKYSITSSSRTELKSVHRYVSHPDCNTRQEALDCINRVEASWESLPKFLKKRAILCCDKYPLRQTMICRRVLKRLNNYSFNRVASG